MRTYNVSVERLRALADAIEAGYVSTDDVRLKATGDAEMTIIQADEVGR